ncbi:MOSC domain-containing protein, partial [Oscillatoria amoena NRMC-F 0135]|nr:MOSC domain-containing protein [Oscillatoria amoena NRMC-F 0135]
MPGRLSEIWIYPVKSLAGIRVRQAMVLEKGLEHDRRFMLVDSDNRFITQREHPELALFDTKISGRQLHITHRVTNQSVMVNLNPTSPAALPATIWNDAVIVSEVDDKTSEWFAAQLNMTCKLVHFPEENPRPVDTRYVMDNEQVSLADGYPYLIIGQASLDDLNTRLAEPIGINRFRPNFVFTGGDPYEEDGWKDFSIGSIHFTGVKNCARCVLTTVDPVSGKKGNEPLRTLSSYRKKNGKVVFGQNVVTKNEGIVT